MLRSFQLRDLALVHRLGDRGVMLQAEIALTNSTHPVRQAVLGKLVGRRSSTFVWKSKDSDAAAFAQLGWDEGSSSAHLVCLAADAGDLQADGTTEVNEGIWLTVLDQLAVEVGSRGVHSLIAEVDENGPELLVLRRSGFAVYTRQDIWIQTNLPDLDKPTMLAPHRSVDDWDVHVLYANIVPGLIQSVEPNPPIDSGKNWILREKDELAAFIHVAEGPVANWMRLLIHPNAHTMPVDIIQDALRIKPPSPDHPLYCSVRRYQSWLQTYLEESGFQYWGSQAVMVRQIVRRVDSAMKLSKPGLDVQTVPSSPPLVQGFVPPNGAQQGK